MFGKKPQPDATKSEQSAQTQSLSGVALTGSTVQMGQAGGSLQQTQTATQQVDQAVITRGVVK